METIFGLFQEREQAEAVLIDFGVSPEMAEAYRAGVKSGGLLFFVRVEDERAGEAAEALRRNGSKQVQGFA